MSLLLLLPSPPTVMNDSSIVGMRLVASVPSLPFLLMMMLLPLLMMMITQPTRLLLFLL